MKHISILQSDAPFGNFCWPSVARLKDGRIVAVCSGLRLAHVCPFGKVVCSISEDDGKTWSAPITLIDSPLDDRDAGITPYGDGFIITTFTNTREFQLRYNSQHPLPEEQNQLVRERVAQITDEEENAYFGAFYYVFGPDLKERYHGRIPLSAPHGMSVLADGRLMYVGRYTQSSETAPDENFNRIGVTFSEDGKHFGEITWVDLALEKYPDRTMFCEPHGIGLSNGKILLQYRVEMPGVPFAVYQSVSLDGGKTFTVPKPLSVPEKAMSGSPPHMLELKDGRVVLTYGYRLRPFGQRARISRDFGESWGEEIVLRDDGLSWDLGYPATVELLDGRLLTVYYQIPTGHENRAILGTVWSADALSD